MKQPMLIPVPRKRSEMRCDVIPLSWFAAVIITGVRLRMWLWPGERPQWRLEPRDYS